MNRRLTISIALAAGGIMACGCTRPAPAPHRVEQPRRATADGKEPIGLSAAEPKAPLRARTVIRDEAVIPASVEVAVPPPMSESQIAADALTRIGPPAVPTLLEALHSTDQDVRRQACLVLMRMGPDAKDAVPDLVLLLDGPDEELRRMAAIALGRIGPDAGQAVPALMRQMLDAEAVPLQQP